MKTPELNTNSVLRHLQIARQFYFLEAERHALAAAAVDTGICTGDARNNLASQKRLLFALCYLVATATRYNMPVFPLE